MGSTYLEMSKDGGRVHKFYEVSVEGQELVTRYGRIGTRGTTRRKPFGSAEAASAAADKKVADKLRLGYAPATPGERKKRAALSGKAPVLWRFKAKASALGIYVDDARCWVGDEAGNVFALSLEGEVEAQFRLSAGVKALVADDRWIYAGCDDGKVYDLSRKVPTVAYEVESATKIYWLDIYSGALCVSDSGGGCTVYDHEGEKLWGAKSKGEAGWMVRADAKGVYHGNGGWVTAGCVTGYSWAGKRRWQKPTQGGVSFGWQEATEVYASTTEGWIHTFTKSGEAGPVCEADIGILSCATSPGGRFIFGGSDRGEVYCFAADATRIWKLKTGCGSPQSMQFHKDRLYIVTTGGYLACIDASEAAVLSASQGAVPKVRDVKISRAIEAREAGVAVEVADAGEAGVVVRCVKVGGKLRVRPASPGYNAEWNVQFPRSLREEGALFLVEGLVEASQGGFYRTIGEIKRTRDDPHS